MFKDQTNEQVLNVEDINHFPKEKQAELIADTFTKISQEYDEVNTSDIKVPFFKIFQ